MRNNYTVTVTRNGEPIQVGDFEALNPSHAKIKAIAWRKCEGLHEPADKYDATPSDPAGDDQALAVMREQVSARYDLEGAAL